MNNPYRNKYLYWCHCECSLNFLFVAESGSTQAVAELDISAMDSEIQRWSVVVLCSLLTNVITTEVYKCM